MLFPTEILTPSRDAIQKIITLLMNDGVIALPTETVYGLAGNATSITAVKKIFAAKERPSFDPLIVHIAEHYIKNPKGPIQALVDAKIISAEVANWPSKSEIEKLMKQFWPGPLTLVLPKGPAIPNETTSNQTTVGIRMPAHPLFQQVLAGLNFPLAAPSANRFGRISPTQPEHVLTELNGRIPVILDGGRCEVGVESTIVGISHSAHGPLTVTLLRPGKIGANEIEATLNTQVTPPQRKEEVTPGSLDQHYAPTKPLLLVPYHFLQNEAADYISKNILNISKKKSVRAGVLATTLLPANIEAALDKFNVTVTERRVLSANKSLSIIAQSLFRTLRDLDQSPNIDLLVADIPSSQIPVAKNEQGLRPAILDRLNRASTNKPL